MSKWTIGGEPLGEVGDRSPTPLGKDAVNRDAIASLPGWGAAPDTYPVYVWGGGRESHNSATELVVGGFRFNPAQWEYVKATPTFYFGGVGVRTNPITSVALKLYSGTTYIGGVAFNSTSLTEVVTPVAKGTGAPAAGEFGNGPYYYEVRISKTGGTTSDYIELYSAYVLIYLAMG